MQEVNYKILRQRHLLCLFLLVMALFSTQAQAGKAIDRLNAFFTTEGAFRASFIQKTKGATFSQPRESRGTFLMRRPGKFRWHYQSPYEQLILADGKRLWLYDVDLDQVVVKPLDAALGNTPALLLSGEGLSGDSLKQQFIITESNEAQDGLYWVQLLPKEKEANFQEVKLGFGEKYIRKMVMIDGFGQQTELDFSDVEVGIKLPLDSFRFTPPKGVDVIGNPDIENE